MLTETPSTVRFWDKTLGVKGAWKRWCVRCPCAESSCRYC